MGEKKITESDPEIIDDLLDLIEPFTRGDPESPLRWLSKSARKLANVLNQQGHSVCDKTVAELLRDEEYTLQANCKRDEGAKAHPDRDAQFTSIAKKSALFRAQQQPVISVDTQKKKTWATTKILGENIVNRDIRARSMPMIL